VKEVNFKDGILYDSSHMMFSKRQNYGNSKKISGCQGLGGEKDEQMKNRRVLGQ
jgi:hypothetical protein